MAQQLKHFFDEQLVRSMARELGRVHAPLRQRAFVGDEPRVRLEQVTLDPEVVRIGGELRFSFVLVSTAKATQKLLVDYAVHFVKANGTVQPKVFKLRRLDIEPAARVELRSKVSFENLTTRRHYPGRHVIDVLVNGVSYRFAEFELRASRK